MQATNIAAIALKPFHRNAAGDFWTSTQSRYINQLGYTYPELVGSPPNTTLIADIKKKYSGPADVPVSAKSKLRRQDSNSTESEKTLYLAQVKLPLHGLADEKGNASPYGVSIFLGDISDDAKSWATSDSLIGSAGSLGSTHMVNSDEVTTSTLDLEHKLKEAIAGGKTTAENAVEYLKSNLKYRIEYVSTLAKRV